MSRPPRPRCYRWRRQAVGMAGGQAVSVRIAMWSAHHPARAVLGWVAFIVLCVAAGAATGTNKGVVSDFWMGEAGRAEAAAAAAGVTPRSVEHVLITAPGRSLDAAAAAVRDVQGALRQSPGVAEVGEPVRSADGGTLRIPVTLAGDTETAKKTVRGVLERTAAVQAAHPEVTIAQTGSASVSVGVNDQQGQDLARTEMISLPITFVVLLVTFGAVLAAALPVVLALSAFAGSVGLYGVASWVFPDAGGAAISVVFLLGMAVGVDYALFYLKRVREERARSGDTLTHAAAVEIAAATAGRSIMTSGVAVIVSLAGLYVVDDVIFSSVATGAVLVVAVAVAGSLTALPALLVGLGGRVGHRSIGRRRAASDGRWSALLQPALRRPVTTLLVGAVLTAALALPAASMRLGNEGKETFPAGIPAVATYSRLTQAFPDEGAQHLVVVRADPGRTADAAAGIDELVRRIGGGPARTVSADGTTTVLQVPVGYPENSLAARASLDRLRAELLPAALGGTGAEYAVSGEVARGVDYSAHQAGRIPWVIGFVCVATLVVMLVAFGSVVLALIGVVINLAAVVGAWGGLTLVFQNDWAEGLLGFTSTGFIGSRMPLMILAILVGLSTDYQIFVVSRIREAVRRGVPTRQAVLDGMAASASVVTSAAVIMVSVFVSFIFIDRIEMKQVGVGLTIAVLFDAVVLRILILPAVMTMLGERCWWPRGGLPTQDLSRPPRARAART
ncbi:MMPL family transporter [Pseudonocardia sp. CA-142604]|uniref:MMPL family transporter n=1 Tax=Pseudonocardia sp. CA-142604 TaxID=3240024 RepID=UPI003D9013B4